MRARLIRHISLLSLVYVLCAWCPNDVVNAAEFHGIVERNGTVALCLSVGALLFPDRCAGNGRLSIVQPIEEGTVVWRSVTGMISLENATPNPECALSHAQWDSKQEEVISTGKKITKVDKSDLLKRLKQQMLKDADVVEGDINTAFGLDLDGDGKEEIVFVASSLERVADHYANDDKPVPFFVYGGILENGSQYPAIFYNDHGDYLGATDTIGSLIIKGVVPIAPGTGELALLIKGGSGLFGAQTLVRYRFGNAQRIETFEFTCN
jgi:hypothetical protein